MSGEDAHLLKRAGIFALGMSILLYSIYTVVLSAAYVVAIDTMYFDPNMYNIGVALTGAMGGFIGSLLVFYGWHTEEE